MINYYDELEELKANTYYHGTSDILCIDSLLPSNKTGNIREQELRKVYITTNYGSAMRYAYKACDKFGGNPIVYKVIPDYDTIAHRIDSEYICDYATIIEKTVL